MEIARTPIKTGGYSIPSKEELDSRPVLTSSSEATGAAFDLAVDETAMMIGQRLYSVNELENQTKQKLTPAQANERFPNMPVPFREDVNPYIAQLQYDKMEEKRRLEAKIQNGPDDAWTQTKTIGAGFVAHMMDPLEIGASMLTGWGVGNAIGRTAWGAQMALKSPTAFAAVESVAGNLIENTIQEVGIAEAQGKEGVDYDPVQGLANIAISTFAGTGVSMGIKAAAKGIGSTKIGQEFNAGVSKVREKIRLTESEIAHNVRERFLGQTSPEADLPIARSIVSNLDNDYRPNLSPMLNTLGKEIDVNPGDFGGPRYDYAPLADAKERKFYAATKDATTFADGQRIAIHDDYKLGTQITDNPGRANAASVRTLSDSTGAVHEMQIQGELRPANLNDYVPDNMKEWVGKQLEYLDVKFDEEMSLKDVLDTFEQAIDEGGFDPSFRAELKEELMSKGYNALISDGTTHLGVPQSAHNALTILDDSLLSEPRSFSPDRQMVRPPDQADVKALESRTDFKNRTIMDGEKFDAFVERTKAIADTPEQIDFKKDIQETLEELDSLEKQGMFDEGEAKQLQSLREANARFGTNWTLLKAVKSCVGL